MGEDFTITHDVVLRVLYDRIKESKLNIGLLDKDLEDKIVIVLPNDVIDGNISDVFDLIHDVVDELETTKRSINNYLEYRELTDDIKDDVLWITK